MLLAQSHSLTLLRYRILEDLFAFFGSFLPSFDIDVPFVEEIKEEVFEAKDEITEALGNFADMWVLCYSCQINDMYFLIFLSPQYRSR